MAEFTLQDREETEIETQRREVELVNELQQRLDEAPSDVDQERLLEIVDELFSILPVRFEFDDCNGYLHEVTDEFPNWEGQVQALFMEQAHLYERLRDIRNELRRIDDSERVRTAMVHWLKVWTECLLLHESEERRLRQIAVNFDPGGQD